MQRLLPTMILGTIAVFAPTMQAESHNPADYPLRIHIYRRSETTFYHNRQAEEAKGEGRANLFEGGEPKGLDFQFECDTKLQTSSGFETFPAKWKTPGQASTVEATAPKAASTHASTADSGTTACTAHRQFLPALVGELNEQKNLLS